MIVLSIAHSLADPGNTHCGLIEHSVSKTMTAACAAALRGAGVVCALLPESLERDHLPAKVELINGQFSSELAVEIHTNGVADPRPNYGFAIHHPGSRAGRVAAQDISASLERSLLTPHGWPSKGAMPDERGLYFLRNTLCPSVIVEPLFQSNEEQSAWLKTTGAPESIGRAVAEGILVWLSAKKESGVT